MNIMTSYRHIIFTGTVIWFILLIVQFTTFYQEVWARLILALAALVWLPLALPLVSTRNVVLEQLLHHLLLPAAALLAFALFLPASSIAALFTLPWFLFTLLTSLRGIIYFFQNVQSKPAVLAIAAAHVFLSIGGAWTLADRLGWQPLGFDPAIVLLTGVHFHYAGFIFPCLIGLATLQHPSFLLKTSSWLAIMAVPLTAAGITLTQWYQSSTLEIIAAATVTLAGAGTALGYWNFIIKKRITGWVKALWLTLALALLTSMMLALLYALRFWFITEWLSIPAMRALHGTLNALLVSGGGLLGWHIYTTESRTKSS